MIFDSTFIAIIAFTLFLSLRHEVRYILIFHLLYYREMHLLDSLCGDCIKYLNRSLYSFVTKEIFISSCFFFSWITCFDTFNEIVKIDITYYWYLYSYWYYFIEGKRWYFVFWRFYSITDVHRNVFYVCWSKFFRSQPRGIKSSPRGNS